MVHAKAARRCQDCPRRITGHGGAVRCMSCAARQRYIAKHGAPAPRVILKCSVCDLEFSDYASNKKKPTKERFCSARCRAAWVAVENSVTRGGDGRRRSKRERDALDYRKHAAKRRAAAAARYAARKPEIIAALRARDRALKQEVVNAYGGKCVCCGETILEFLTIDHTNGDGHLHRAAVGKGRRIYADLKARGFPRDGYQCMCLNCNISLGFYGYCPHRPEIRRQVNKVPRRPGRPRTVA